MIELNLLPAVKLEYLKAERSRRMVLTICFVVTAASVAILVLLFIAEFAQKSILHGLNNKVSTLTQTLEQKPDINEVLTVQNQLNSLTGLHAAKPAADRLFSTYLDEVTPSAVSINNFQIDFNMHTISISGNADSIKTINQYVDTLKLTTYTYVGNTTPSPAFSNVVLSSFSTGQSSGGTTNPAQAAAYSITLSYDPTIFGITNTIALSVPNITTTRSELTQPDDLFKTAPSASTSTTSGGQ